MSNTAAHYETTGPEIWEDTEGKITHYAAGVGTGGTMCGAATYLKEQNPNIVSVGIDTYGSVFKKYKETGQFDENEIYPYLTEGIGEDILPKNVDFSVIDHFVKVTDKDGAIMARRLAKEEGLFIGWSCGSAVQGALDYARRNLKEEDVMVVVLPDHGSRYLGKIYNDNWMRDHGFMEARAYATARDILKKRNGKQPMVTVSGNTTVGEAVHVMTKKGVSQVPITEEKDIIGSITDNRLLHQLIENPDIRDQPIKEHMDGPFKFVGLDSTVDTLASLIDKNTQALLVRDDKEEVHIITQADLLDAMAP